MPTWTQPKSFSAEKSMLELWNTYLSNNMNALKDPPTDSYSDAYSLSSLYSTTNTEFTDIDANLSLSIATTGGDIFICFRARCSGVVWFDFAVDGARVGGSDGILVPSASFAMYWIVQNLEAGVHTVSVQWKSASATISGTTPPHFSIKEVS